MSRRRRILSDEEAELWARVKATAKPLRPPDAQHQPHATKAKGIPSKEPVPKGPRTEASLPLRTAARQPKAPPPASALDKKTVRNITRGRMAVEKRLDLHGMTQTHAARRLKRFLEDAQANGLRTVLVITGKGAPDEPSWDHTYQGRGILRRSVPEWLRSPDFRSLVSGFSEADRRHGGGGALYVRIKRSR